MEKNALKPYFVIIGLMVLTSLALAFTVDVTVTDEAGIKVFLPEKVAQWQGQELRFCQNGACQKEWPRNALADPDKCPACGQKLASMAYAESKMLPADTVVLKKRYQHPDGSIVFASIVMSGKERASIHRPQVCLVGQGRTIARTTTLPVPLDGRKPLEVAVLDLVQTMPPSEDGKVKVYNSYYAYWFVGKGRETPSHYLRMMWMATDRIFHNVAHRWAYISVSGTRKADSEEYQKQIAGFIHDLYPEMVIN